MIYVWGFEHDLLYLIDKIGLNKWIELMSDLYGRKNVLYKVLHGFISYCLFVLVDVWNGSRLCQVAKSASLRLGEFFLVCKSSFDWLHLGCKLENVWYVVDQWWFYLGIGWNVWL